MIEATVTINGTVQRATECQPVTFGRSTACTICLDEEDTGISRIAGEVSWKNEVWWLVNRSGTRPLIVTDVRIPRNVVPRLRRHPLDAVTRVIVDGKSAQHILAITPHTATDHGSIETESPGLTTSYGFDVRVGEEDLLALAALFEKYMLNPSRMESIRSYDAAAMRIGSGHTSNQVRRRVENLRNRLDAAGVRGLKGANAMQHLAEYLIGAGVLTTADIRRLPPR
jgi:hypothetical protein